MGSKNVFYSEESFTNWLNENREFFTKKEYENITFKYNLWIKTHHERLETFKDLEIPNYSKLVPYILVECEDGVFYLEHILTLLRVDGVYLTIFKKHNTSTCEFNLHRMLLSEKCKNIDLTDLVVPNKVGKATKEKLSNWVEYLTEIERRKDEKLKQINNKINDFLETLKPYENVIEWSNDRKSGRMVKGGLIYRFSITDDGYISENIELHYNVTSNLKSFELMSDNKYQK